MTILTSILESRLRCRQPTTDYQYNLLPPFMVHTVGDNDYAYKLRVGFSDIFVHFMLV